MEPPLNSPPAEGSRYPLWPHAVGLTFLTTAYNLGFLLHAQGEYAAAKDYFLQALEMRKKLYPASRYPQGHPDLAISLNNLGALLRARGENAGDGHQIALLDAGIPQGQLEAPQLALMRADAFG